MMKLLLVDDEDFIRQGMRLAIPWEENDLEVTEASNGQEALEIALRIKPDIVLADIQMPAMNGLELARQLGILLPETRVIILTAYGNTDNLMNAIDVKVSGFLMKNSDSKKILNTVLKVKKELDSQKAHTEKLNQIQGIYNENQVLIKATLVSRFLNNQIPFSHFSKKSSELGMNPNSTSLALAVIKCNCTDEKYAISQFLQYFQEYSPLCFFSQNQTAVLLLDTSRKPLTKQELDSLLPCLQPIALGNFITVMCSIQSYEELPLAYKLLLESLEHCFWNTNQPYTLLTPQDQIISQSAVEPYEYEKAIMKAVIDKNTAEIAEAFSSYYQYMEHSMAPRQIFLDSVLRLIIFISSMQEDDINISRMKELIHETETPKEILDVVRSLVEPASQELSSHTQVALALTYMQEHFAEDLYLDEVAKAVYLSSCYLCRIFKTETGYSFKEYLHKLRIEKAQQLIRDTDYKYYEIAEKVGYKNYKYFSSYFSKITGLSAKEYRISTLN